MAKHRPDSATNGEASCPIVGVGASAGGLDAFRRLLTALPGDTPLAFVLVQHLEPTRPTQLAELLSGVGPLPVSKAKDGVRVESGNVYVVPEATRASMENRVLRLRPLEAHCRAEPIDAFLTSLAMQPDLGACAVLLSGLGSDGVRGLREIAASGGLTFVQDPETAEYPAMPLAAVDEGVADFVGSPERIAAQLHLRVGHPYLLELAGTASSGSSAHADILALLAREAGMDFSLYKHTTVRRRIGRRAMLRDVEHADEYLSVLREDPAELQALLGDLLINVTEFFRDPEVFDALRRRVFPAILKDKTDRDTVRLWVPACSSGEEVYSLLIVLLEALDDLKVRPAVTVFGTDASEAAVRKARAGVYPHSICSVVSPERLARFFEPTERGFQVRKDLRESCIFARQDVTTDTPFSRLDLVSMRNLLIYLQPTLQKRVLAIAHYALAPNGFLVLGTSETPDTEPKLFSAFDKQRHIYRRKNVPAHLPLDVTGPSRISIDALGAAGSLHEHPADFDLQAEADQLALAAFAPPRVLVDGEGHIMHFYGDTTPYLEHAEGRATLDILQFVRPALTLELRDALEAARTTNAPASREATFADEGQVRRVSLQVLPLAAPSRIAHYLVTFVERPASDAPAAAEPGGQDLASMYEAREDRLRREMSALRGKVRSISEEKDVVNQALRSANEEVSSSNEELQSINEELETAKEELQSSNEELITVNDELRHRNRDLARLNDDLANFVDSTDIPVVMVDTDLRVRRHTPSAGRVVHILPSDDGRFLPHLRFRIDVPDLEPLVRDVIESGEAREREVADEDRHWYAMHVCPYIDSEGAIAGAVLSFADIDELKRAMRRVERRAELAAVLNEIDVAVSSTMDFDAMMQLALDKGVHGLGVDAGAIELLEDDHWVVRYQRGFGAELVGERLHRDEAPLATKVAESLEPQVAPDTEADPESRSGFARLFGSRSVLAVPLVVKGAALGCITFHAHGAPRSFEGETGFARRLAASVSLAIEARRVLAAERRAARQAETLNRVNEMLMSALTPDDLLARLVGDVSQTAGADRCLVIETRGGRYTVTHVRNVRDDLVVGKPKDATYYPGFALAAGERRPVLIEDNWNDPRTNKDFVVPHELRAFQLLPLVVEGEAVAVLALAYDAPRSFDKVDGEFAARLSTAMSLAMRNVLLFGAERDRRRLSQALAEIDRAIHSSLDLDAVIERALAEGAGALGADTGAVSVYEEPTFRVTHSFGFDPDLAGLVLDERTEKHSLLAVQTREPVIVADTQSDPRVDAEHLASYGVLAVMVVPLVVKGTVTGCVYYNYRHPRSFSPDQVEFVTGLGASLALALENARLYESEVEAQRQALQELERTRLLQEVSLAAVSGNDITKIAEGILDAVRSRLRPRIGDIKTFDAESGRLDLLAQFGHTAKTVDRIRHLALGRSDYLTVRAFEEGRMLTHEDEDLTPERRTVLEEAGLTGHRYFVTPVSFHGEKVGSFALTFEGARPFSSAELELFDAIGHILGQTMQGARLFAEVRENEGRLALLADSARLLLAAEEPERIVQRIAEQVMGYLGCQVFLNYLIEDGGGSMRLNAYAGIPDDKTAEMEILRLGEGVCGRVGIDGECIIAEDIQAGGDERTRLVRSLGIQAFACHPLVYQGHTIGTLAFGKKTRSRFAPEEIELMRVVADQAATAMARKRAEETLRESRTDLARAQTVAHVGSWRIDRRGRQLQWSDETYRMFGVPPGTPLDYGAFLSFIHPDDREQVDAAWSAALGGEPYDIEHRVVVDGEVKWVREQAELETDEHGELLGGFGTVQDITERKLAESRLQRERREVETANRLLALFVSEKGDDLYRKALEDLLSATESRYGVFGYVDEAGDLICPTMSDVFDECEMEEKCIVYGHHKWTGLWGRALVERHVFVTNDGPRVPPGHIPMTRNLAVPIVFGGESIGLVNLANKDTDYTAEDVAFMEGVTGRIAPVLYAWIQQELRERERAEAAERITQALDAVEMERARLREIIEDIPMGVALMDGEGRVLEINPANDAVWAGTLAKAASIDEFSLYEGYHRGTGERLQPDEWPGPRSIASGERVEDVVDIRRLDGTTGTARIEAIPVKDETGAVARVVVITQDVTEAVEREHLETALNEVRTSITATFDPDEILGRVLEAGLEALRADSAGLVMKEDRHWRVARVLNGPQDVVGDSFPDDEGQAASIAARERRPVVVEDTRNDSRVNPEMTRRAGIGSMLIIPLIAQGRTIGAASFHYSGPLSPGHHPRVDFVARLMSVVALALDNAKTYERERTIADTLQEAVLAPPPPIEGLEVGYLYRPASATARVGGDFYDLFPLGDGRAGVVVGDVSGKGIDAARLTSLVRDGIRAYSYEHADPAEVLGHVNVLVRRSSPVESFATVFFGVLDLETGTLRYCAAGHPPPFIVGPGRVERLPDPQSTIVGAFDAARFQRDKVSLRDGDSIVLFTDGITEARRDGELYGEQRLEESLRTLVGVPPLELPVRIVEEVQAFTGGRLQDDTVVLCVRWDADRAG